ncbi:MAG: LysR substrate-binding domain-containing protein [Pseudomonadota bacterium]
MLFLNACKLLAITKTMKIHQLRDFIAIAKEGGIRAAARHLDLAQPSLSKSVNALEIELGTPLFERTGTGSILNSYGEALLVRAEHVMTQIERARDEIHQLKGGRGGHVNFGASGTPSLLFVPGALQRFRQRFSDAQVRIVEGAHSISIAGLRDGSLDFSMVPEPIKPLGAEFSVERVFESTRSVVGRRGHPLAKAKSLGDLATATWLLTGAAGPKRMELDSAFTSNGFAPPAANVQCESLIGLLSLLASTDLLALLPHQWVETPITAGVLAEIVVREKVSAPAICLIKREGLPLTPAAEAMADSLRTEAASYALKAPAVTLSR